MKARTADGLALALAVLSVITNTLVADRVFERIPHIEDEFAFLWQAEVMADGFIDLPSPEYPTSFLVPFVVDHEGHRFGKYTPGWPAALSLGAGWGVHWLVNPLLGGLAVWLVFRLGSKLIGRGVGLIAGVLMATSPMYFMLSGSFMSHNLSLVLAISFTLAWLDLFPQGQEVTDTHGVPTGLLVAVGGLSLGLLGITRPLTALGIFIPFGVHGLVILLRGGSEARWRVLVVILLAIALLGIIPLWQAALTGQPLLNPYTLWWEYDRVGFGPEIGVTESGHNLRLAYDNTRFSLRAGVHDAFGWPYLSWLFLPFGLIALWRRRDGWLLAAMIPSLVLTYGAYWIGSWLFGPRYYYEALPALAMLSAAGVGWLGGWMGQNRSWMRFRRLSTVGLLSILIGLNILFYLPARVGGMKGLYGISAAYLRPIQGAKLDHALILVHSESWHRYGNLRLLSPPFETSDLLVAWEIKPEQDQAVIEMHAERQVFHYYPDEPYTLYGEER